MNEWMDLNLRYKQTNERTNSKKIHNTKFYFIYISKSNQKKKIQSCVV